MIFYNYDLPCKNRMAGHSLLGLRGCDLPYRPQAERVHRYCVPRRYSGMNQVSTDGFHTAPLGNDAVWAR